MPAFGVEGAFNGARGALPGLFRARKRLKTGRKQAISGPKQGCFGTTAGLRQALFPAGAPRAPGISPRNRRGKGESRESVLRIIFSVFNSLQRILRIENGLIGAQPLYYLSLATGTTDYVYFRK